ncbi:outer membrane receptor protein involved in Fe transport [Flavobacterium arsenatis]|uniref:Outer membrane receptor protein involved in Fe transport n=1 Tax=Flavobacterium arsenatis TaxID=1484332 RepID=A0ABU1TK56_9FLAO|nr:TonB-dependent receptor [Flavobacterium arsenatis]MDR6966362.1 outer membrane receptor protein involved in Fe transport [Flavobacterium arsenatis]
MLVLRKCSFLILLCSFFSMAQNGTISGRIAFEDNNEPAFSVTVLVKNNSFKQQVVTSENGNYSFSNVPYGKYTLQISSIEAETKSIEISVSSSNTQINNTIKRAGTLELQDVSVVSKSTKKKIEERGFAVNVIETKNAELQSIQTNQLLDRTAGVRVRQAGGLGSNADYILNGLSGNSVKIFIDGVPIRNFGPSFSLNSIPPSLIQRVEIYKGVVPAHLSDDAMGGAINIVMKNSTATNLTASVSGGSFGTYLADINGSFRDEKTGFTVRGSGFFNYADNDYDVWGREVAVQLAPGTPDVYITAKRFHDRYRSQGGRAEVGYTNVKWADKLMIGALFSNMDKQIQNGATMEIVYGNRFTEQKTKMINLDYSKRNIVDKLDVSVFGSFSELNRKTVDTIATQYSWLGHPTNYFNNPDVWASGAEAGLPTLQEDIDKNINTRTNIRYRFTPNNSFQINHLLNTFSRTSDDPMLPPIENAMMEERKYMKNIIAFSYENSAFNNRLRTTLFAKSYLMNRSSTIRNRSGNNSNSTLILVTTDINSDDLGYGAAISFDVTKKLSIFGSAEKAIRLPESGELFGIVSENLNGQLLLRPEKSNNYNFGLALDNLTWKKHNFGFRGNVFIRDTKDLIMKFPVGNLEEFFSNTNVGKIYTEGFDLELNYNYNKEIFFTANTSIFDARDYEVTYDTNGNPVSPTYQRLANTPYSTMNYNLRTDHTDLFQKGSRFSFYYNLLYVHAFFRHSNTLGGFGKTVIPTQASNDTGFAYTFPNRKLTLSFDAKNIFNRQIFDNYALQKPGRGFYTKLTYTIL